MKRGMTTIGVVGTAAGTVAAGVVFTIGLLGPEITKMQDNQYQDHGSLTAALGDITTMKEDISSIRESTASTQQLLHDLSRDRLQYPPYPSEEKALNNIASTTNVQTATQN